MKALTLAVGVAAFFAFTSAQACPYMDKVTKNLKNHTNQVTDATQTPTLPEADQKLIVKAKKPTEGVAN